MERMTKEELKKELEKLKDFKVYVFEGDVYVKAEDYKEIAIENKKLKEKLEELEEGYELGYNAVNELLKENKKLKEFKTKREESMFYFKALAERVEPINSKEAEELQKYKKLFEKLYREELYYLEEENKKLKEELEWYKKQYQHSMGEDNGKLTKGGYASFNEYGELMEEDTLQELRDLGKL